MKNVLLSLLVVGGLLFTISCEKTEVDPNNGKIQLIVKSSTGVKSTAFNGLSYSNYQSTGLTLEKFYVNIDELEFGVDEDASGLPEDVLDSLIDAQELKGPFVIDILSQEALNGLSLGTSIIPNAVYDKIEFKFDQYPNASNAEMYQKSMYLIGALNGVPTKIWTDQEIEIKIEFPDSTNFTVNSNNVKIYIDFSISKITNSLNQFDFSSAVDGNHNGVIEIGPDNIDGNGELAHFVEKCVEESIDLDDKEDED